MPKKKYSRKRSAPKESFESVPAKRKSYISSLVRISVEGFNPLRPENEIKSELINHFESCGDIMRIDLPTDPDFDSRAFVNFHGHESKEKALQLNGSDIGDWNALVKYAPEEEEEEYQVAARYESSLYADLAKDERFFFGVAVLGYDTSLPEDDVERALRAHFSSCEEITHVYVCPPDRCTNIYFSKEKGEASALALKGSKVGGFKITTMRVATVRSIRPRAPGRGCGAGLCMPAHFLEFADECSKKLADYMTEWRAKAKREKVRALEEAQVQG